MDFLSSALNYASLGYKVFPCYPGRKNPIPKNGFLDATTDEETINAWWSSHPNANIAIAADGLLVVDVDDRDFQWLSDSPDRRRDIESADAQARTPRGGFHYFFRAPEGSNLRCTQGELANGVDTRTAGGYVLVEPSVVSGKPYRWIPGVELDTSNLAPPPRWLVEALEGATKRPKTASADGGEQIPEGRRNGTLASRAGSLRRSGFSVAAIAAALHQINMEQCSPPLPHHEVEAIASSVSRYEPDPTAELMAEDFSDVNLDQFMAWFKGAVGKPVRAPDVGGEVLELVDWDDVGREDVEPLVEGILLPGRWTSICAGAKQGKTTFIVASTAPLTLGIDPFDETAVKPVRVLHVDYELGRVSMLQDVLTPCGWEDPKRQLPGWFCCDQGGYLSTKKGAETLINTVLHHDIRVVVIDGINGSIDTPENEDRGWRNLFELLIRPLKTHGVAVVTAANQGHGEDGRPRGSSIQLDKPDVVFNLKRIQGGVKLKVHNNVRRSMQFHLEIDLEAVGFDGEQTIRYSRPEGEVFPEGTSELAAKMDALGIPKDAGRKIAYKAFKEAGVGVNNNRLAAAIRFRKTLKKPVGTPSGTASFPLGETLGTEGVGISLDIPPPLGASLGRANLKHITSKTTWKDQIRKEKK